MNFSAGRDFFRGSLRMLAENREAAVDLLRLALNEALFREVNNRIHELDEDWLTLSTIHSAKGGEWDVVHVIHSSDGMIPSDMSTGSPEEVDEERRLFYVALTRAKDRLNVYFPLRYYHKKWSSGDRHTYAQITRFLPNNLLEHFERVRLEEKSPPPAVPGATTVAAAEIRGKIAGMWND